MTPGGFVDHQGRQGDHPPDAGEALGKHEEHQGPRAAKTGEAVADPESVDAPHGGRDGRFNWVSACSEAAPLEWDELVAAGERQDPRLDEPRPPSEPRRRVDEVMEADVAKERHQPEGGPHEGERSRGTWSVLVAAKPPTRPAPPRAGSPACWPAASWPPPSRASRRGTSGWPPSGAHRPRSARGDGGRPRRLSARRRPGSPSKRRPGSGRRGRGVCAPAQWPRPVPGARRTACCRTRPWC